MTKAQVAWAVLTGMLLIAAVVMFTVPTANNPVLLGSIFMGFGLFGWIVLAAMIFNDVSTNKT